MTTSESPTHPDAPRAGGETPELLNAERVERLRSSIALGRAREPHYSSNIVVTADELEALLNAWASLLARHRDGERDYEAKFSELAALPENWDSYGGNRIWPEAIEAARRILSVLARPADVVPTTYGGIQLEWYRQGVAVEVRITPEGSIEYADAELYTLPATPPAASEPTEGASSD